MKDNQRMKALLKKCGAGLFGLFAVPAFADGFTAAEGLLETIQAGLDGLSLVTITIAVLWVGYKVLFGGSTLKECAPIIIGAIVIASAAEVATMMTS